jgi:hypothetical protein
MNQRGDSSDVSLAGAELSAFAAVCVVVYQVYLYLKHGTWVSLSVLDALLYLLRKNPPPWLLYPDDWVGVHKLLDKTPLALCLVILGIVWIVIVGFLGAKLEEYHERKQRDAEKKGKRQDDSH